MAIMEITVIPITGKSSVSEYVADALKVVKESGLNFQLTPTATVIEGDIDKLFELAKRIHLAMIEEGVWRNLTLIKIDDRRDKKIDMEYKVRSVMEKM